MAKKSENDNDNDLSSSQLPVTNNITCLESRRSWALRLPVRQNARVWQKVAASDVLAQADARETKWVCYCGRK